MSEFSTLNGYKVKDKKATRFYDNVESMINDTTLKEGMLVKTKGYYLSNDGGNADYDIRSTESNTEHQEQLINGLYATLIIKDYINPEMFGAYGDGVHNDTESMEKCFEISESLNKKIIATKTYLITRSLNFNGVIDGQNLGLIKSDQNSRFEGAFIKSTSKLTIKNINFNCGSNIEFVLADKFVRYNNAISCDNTENVIIENCNFNNLYNMFIEIKGNNNKLIRIENNNFSSDNKTNIYMSPMISIININNEDCDINIHNNTFKGYSYEYVSTIDNDSNCNANAISSSNINVKTYQIKNNLIEDLGKYGSTNTSVGYSRLCAIDFYYNVQNVIVKNNIIKNCHWSALRLHGTNNAIIEDNYFSINKPCSESLMIITDAYNSTGELPVGTDNVTIKNNIFETSNDRVSQAIFINGYSKSNENIQGIYGHVDNLKISYNLFDGNFDDVFMFDCSLKNCLINKNTVKANRFIKAIQQSYIISTLPGIDYSNTILNIIDNIVHTDGVCIYLKGTDANQDALFDLMSVNLKSNDLKTNGNNYIIYGTSTGNVGTAIKNILHGYGGFNSIKKLYNNVVFYNSSSAGHYNETVDSNNDYYTLS